MILDKAPGFGLVLPELSLAELVIQCCDVNMIMTSYIISYPSVDSLCRNGRGCMTSEAYFLYITWCDASSTFYRVIVC